MDKCNQRPKCGRLHIQVRPPRLRRPSRKPPSRKAVTWKDITIERTLREEIEERYGAGESSGRRVLYQIGSIPASILFGEDTSCSPSGSHRRFRWTRQTFWLPTARRTGSAVRNFVRFWEYDQKGMTVEFASDDKLVTSVEYRASKLPVGKKEVLVSKTLVPSRPALTNVSASWRASKPRSRSGQSFSWVGANLRKPSRRIA